MKNKSYERPWLRVFELKVNKAILVASYGDCRDEGLDNYEGVNLDD